MSIAANDYQNTQNEVARRNYALTTETHDCENMLQIKCGGEILVTVCQPAGPTVPTEFLVFNGDGLDAEDNDLTAADAVKVFPVRLDVNDAWRQAARFGYLHALARMMTADIRQEVEDMEMIA